MGHQFFTAAERRQVIAPGVSQGSRNKTMTFSPEGATLRRQMQKSITPITCRPFGALYSLISHNPTLTRVATDYRRSSANLKALHWLGGSLALPNLQFAILILQLAIRNTLPSS